MTKEQIDVIVADLAKELIDLVKTIEAKEPTTQNHYGDYMNIMSVTAKGNRTIGKFITAALLDAGANAAGVASAYKIVFG